MPKGFDKRWRSLPQHLRRGLLRLYIAVTGPWIAWFGYRLLVVTFDDPYWSWDDVSQDFWLLLAIPIGGPLLFFVIAWIIAGFRRSAFEATMPENSGRLAVSANDYYSIIARAVSNLQDNSADERKEVYDQARKALSSHLAGENLYRETQTLERAIRDLEAVSAAKQYYKYQKASTILLVASMYFPVLWVLDVTSMSLYWVARLPKAPRSSSGG